MSKKKKDEVIIKVTKDTEGAIDLLMENISPVEVLGICSSLIATVSKKTGIDYNSLVEDIKIEEGK